MDPSMMAPGDYRTKAGSILTLREKGGWVCDWDWFEENACFEARPVDVDRLECALVVCCECCGTAIVGLTPIAPEEDEADA